MISSLVVSSKSTSLKCKNFIFSSYDMYGDYDKTDYVIYDQEQLQNNQNLAQYNSEQNSHRADSSEQVGQNTSEYVYVDQVQYDNGYTTDYQYAAPAQNPSLTDFIDEF